MFVFIYLIILIGGGNCGYLGAGTGEGSCAAYPFRSYDVQWKYGCPGFAPCCSEYGYCRPIEEWEYGHFRDCNGVSNGSPLPPDTVAMEAAAPPFHGTPAGEVGPPPDVIRPGIKVHSPPHNPHPYPAHPAHPVHPEPHPHLALAKSIPHPSNLYDAPPHPDHQPTSLYDTPPHPDHPPASLYGALPHPDHPPASLYGAPPHPDHSPASLYGAPPHPDHQPALIYNAPPHPDHQPAYLYDAPELPYSSPAPSSPFSPPLPPHQAQPYPIIHYPHSLHIDPHHEVPIPHLPHSSHSAHSPAPLVHSHAQPIIPNPSLAHHQFAPTLAQQLVSSQPGSFTPTPLPLNPFPRRPSPNTLSGTPTPAPHQFGPTHSPVGPTHPSFGPTHPSFGPTPTEFNPTSAQFSPTPPSFSPTPQSFSPTPSSFSPTSQSFSPTPSSFSPTPLSFSPTPPSFSPTPPSFSPTPPSFSLSPQSVPIFPSLKSAPLSLLPTPSLTSILPLTSNNLTPLGPGSRGRPGGHEDLCRFPTSGSYACLSFGSPQKPIFSYQHILGPGETQQQFVPVVLTRRRRRRKIPDVKFSQENLEKKRTIVKSLPFLQPYYQAVSVPTRGEYSSVRRIEVSAEEERRRRKDDYNLKSLLGLSSLNTVFVTPAPTFGLVQETGSRFPSSRGRVEPDIKGRIEPETEGRIEPETEGRMEPEMEGRMEPEMEGRMEPEMEGRMEPETEGRIEPEMEGRMESDIKGRIESDIKGRIEPEMEGRIEHDLKGRMEHDLKGRMQPDIEGRMESDIEGQMESDIKGRIESDIKGRMEPDIEGRMESDIEGRMKSDFEGRMEPDIDGRMEPDIDYISLEGLPKFYSNSGSENELDGELDNGFSAILDLGNLFHFVWSKQRDNKIPVRKEDKEDIERFLRASKDNFPKDEKYEKEDSKKDTDLEIVYGIQADSENTGIEKDPSNAEGEYMSETSGDNIILNEALDEIAREIKTEDDTDVKIEAIHEIEAEIAKGYMTAKEIQALKEIEIDTLKEIAMEAAKEIKVLEESLMAAKRENEKNFWNKNRIESKAELSSIKLNNLMLTP